MNETRLKSLPKLFVSFSGVMMKLSCGLVSRDDLETGLFAFGCTRDHVFRPGFHGEYVEDEVLDRPDLHQQLLEALRRAERDGRVSWRRGSRACDLVGECAFRRLNRLLRRNGFKPLLQALAGNSPLGSYSYTYKEVERRSRELQVVY